MDSDTFDKEETLTAEESLQPKMVTVEIAGKIHQVPAGITLMKALWYTGHDVVRGAGCLGRLLRGMWNLLPDQRRSQSQNLLSLLLCR